jgi:putative membrane protein
MREKIGVFVKRLLAGMVIGIGGILPGVSGSVLAVAFGLYARILDAIATFFKDVKGNVRFLFPVLLGGAVGLYGFSVILNRMMARYETVLVFLFCGLVAGSMPSLMREAKRASGVIKRRYWIMAAVGFALSLLMLFIERDESSAASVSIGPMQAAISGAILAAGSILPGVSTSFILIRLGWYAPMMNALSSLNIALLLWAGVGALASGVALIGLVRFLLRRFPGWVYMTVIGLMAGTIITSLPTVTLEWKSLLYIIPLVLGAVGAYYMASIADESTTEDKAQ